MWAHERIAFEEALRITMVIRSPGIDIKPKKITEPTNSLDFLPTLLGIIGFDIDRSQFDGIDTLEQTTSDRKVYFSGWLSQSPFGYMLGNKKYIYDPQSDLAMYYDLDSDPNEQQLVLLPEEDKQILIQELADGRRASLYPIKVESGKTWLYNNWKCRWNNRIASAKFKQNNSN